MEHVVFIQSLTLNKSKGVRQVILDAMNAVGTAEKAADEKLEAAREEAGKIISKAKEEADKLIKDARKKALADKEKDLENLEKKREEHLLSARKDADQKAAELKKKAGSKEEAAIDAVITACL